jgi:Zn-dependent protease
VFQNLDLAGLLQALPVLLAVVGFKLGAMLAGAIFHEVGHGWVAYRLGDPTARDAGRLTFNPLAHIDLVSTIVVPLILLVAGFPPLIMFKPVPVDLRNMRNPRVASVLVSLAGPGANVALAVLTALLFRILAPAGAPPLVEYAVAYFVMINLIFAAFNLLPFPPLDGSHILEAFLPDGALRLFYRIRTYLLVGFLVLVFTPVFGFIWRPLRHGLYDLQVLLTGIKMMVL